MPNYISAQPRDPAEKHGERPSILDYSVDQSIGDGTSHPLSSYYASYALASAVYPFLVSDDWEDVELAWAATTAALAAAIAKGASGEIGVPQGDYLINRSIEVPSCVTLRGVYGGKQVNGGGAPAGSIFRWNGATGGTIIKVYNAHHVQLQGFNLVADAADLVTGIELNGTNDPASHSTRFKNFGIYECEVGIQWGAPTSTEYVANQCDTTEIASFMIQNLGSATAYGITINSGNAGQQSKIEHGTIQVGNVGIWAKICTMSRIVDVAFGSASFYGGVAFKIGYGNTLIIENCNEENAWHPSTNPDAKSIHLTGGNLTGGLILRGNNFNSPIQVDVGCLIYSEFNYSNAELADAAPYILNNAGAQVYSLANRCGPDGKWTVITGKVFELFNTASSTLFPVTVDNLAGDGAMWLFRSSGPNPSVELANDDSESRWQIVFSGSAGISPGDLSIYDAANGRALFTFSTALGASGAGTTVNPYMSPGDFSVCRTSVPGGGAIFFGNSAAAYVDFNLSQTNDFSLVGGKVRAPNGFLADLTDEVPFKCQSDASNPSFQLYNYSTDASQWKFVFPGTGGISPQNLVLRDETQTRQVMIWHQLTGAVGTRDEINGSSAYGDLTVSRAAAAGGCLWFAAGTDVRLDYNLSLAGKFNFTHPLSAATGGNVMVLADYSEFEDGDYVEFRASDGKFIASDIFPSQAGKVGQFLQATNETTGRAWSKVKLSDADQTDVSGFTDLSLIRRNGSSLASFTTSGTGYLFVNAGAVSGTAQKVRLDNDGDVQMTAKNAGHVAVIGAGGNSIDEVSDATLVTRLENDITTALLASSSFLNGLISAIQGSIKDYVVSTVTVSITDPTHGHVVDPPDTAVATSTGLTATLVG